jgi:hypothetical protein
VLNLALECATFSNNKCPIWAHDDHALAKFSNTWDLTDYSAAVYKDRTKGFYNVYVKAGLLQYINHKKGQKV